MGHWEEGLRGDFWLRVGVSLLCGFIVGAERQMRGKPVGIRTSILICLGTMTYVQLAQLPGNTSEHTARVLGQIISGIGFLGGGVILTQGGLVFGVTSAAVVWMLAAIGAAIGLDHYGVAFFTCIIAVGVLLGVEKLETAMKGLRKGVHAPVSSKIMSD